MLSTWVRTRRRMGFRKDREQNYRKGVLLLTRLGSGDAHGEVLWSKIDSIALTNFCLHRMTGIFLDAMGSSLQSPPQAWSTGAYYVDGAQRQPTGNEDVIQRIQPVLMTVMLVKR